MPDPFAILGLPRSFELSSQAIENAYLARSALCHPDLMGDENEASQRSAELNDAKAILVHPESRANALLAAIGGPAKEADRTLPDGFLMQILETREEIESQIATRSANELNFWKEWAAREREAYTAKIAALFRQTPLPDLEIRKQLNAWRYIERLVEQLGDSL